MTLFFIGCSFTYGDDLKNPANDAWPVLVAGPRNFTNAAVSGGTNERTVYQVIKNIDQYDKFYIAWTYIERFTRYRNENNFEVNFNPSLTHHLYGKHTDFIDYARLHYTVWHNHLYAFKLWLQQIILLQSFLEKKHKKYLMLNTTHNHIHSWLQPWHLFNDHVKSLLCFDQMDDAQLKTEHLEIQNLVSSINMSRFLEWGTWAITDLCDRYPVGPSRHLLENGHRAIADHIIQHDTN